MEESERIVFDQILFDKIWNVIGQGQNSDKKRDVKKQIKNNLGKDNYIGLTFGNMTGLFLDLEVKKNALKEQENKYKDLEKKYAYERAVRMNGTTQSSVNSHYYQQKMKEMQEEIDHYRLINQLFCNTMPIPLQQDIKDEFLKKDKKKNYRKIFLKHCENTKIEFPFENYVASKKKLSLVANKKDSDDEGTDGEEDDIPMPPNIIIVSESDSDSEDEP